MNQSIQEPLAVRINEACRLTGIGRSKLYELIASSDIEIVKVGAITLVPITSLAAPEVRTAAVKRPSSSSSTKHTHCAEADVRSSIWATAAMPLADVSPLMPRCECQTAAASPPVGMPSANSDFSPR